MSDLKKPTRTSKDICDLLSSALNGYISGLRDNRIPDENTEDSLRTLLTECIERINYDSTVMREFGTADFRDVSAKEVSDSTIEKEALRDRETSRILFETALKKIVSSNETICQTEGFQHLVKEGCIASVQINSVWVQGKYYSLTSKGIQCFTRNRLVRRIEKDNDTYSVPDALLLAPESWNPISLCKAQLLTCYYKASGVDDYIIFHAPGNCDSLIGCEISASSTAKYSYAWISSTLETNSENAYLADLLESPIVSGVTVVYPVERMKDDICSYLNVNETSEKISFFYLEG